MATSVENRLTVRATETNVRERVKTKKPDRAKAYRVLHLALAVFLTRPQADIKSARTGSLLSAEARCQMGMRDDANAR
jgi:hypothetical protein